MVFLEINLWSIFYCISIINDGTLIYNYPRVQFKILNRQAVLIGLDEGGDLLAQLWLEVDQTKLGLETLSVQESTVQKRRVEIGESESMVTYRVFVAVAGAEPRECTPVSHDAQIHRPFPPA